MTVSRRLSIGYGQNSLLLGDVAASAIIIVNAVYRYDYLLGVFEVSKA